MNLDARNAEKIHLKAQQNVNNARKQQIC